MPQRLKTIYEDDDVLVVAKPAGLAVHTGPGLAGQTTLVDLVRSRVRDESKERPGIVHRLDKDTSGVMILAKHSAAKLKLQRQFKERRVTKTYLALVVGRPQHPAAKLDLPVARSRKNPLKRAVIAGGKPAQTRYATVQEYPHHTLLRVYPQTGRTHQIRVHLSHLGTPVVGDSLYGRPDQRLARHWLHASRLELALPSGQRGSFTAPLPAELESYLEQLTPNQQ